MSNHQVTICHVHTQDLPVLKVKEIKELLIKYQETKDEHYKEQLVLGNLKLVLSIVSKFKQDDLDDLFQVGCVGLIKAIEQFDTSLDVMFSTYAHPLIVGEIKAHIRNKSPLHVSRYLRDLSLKIARMKEDYLQKYHQEIPNELLMKTLNVSEFDLYQIEHLKNQTTSLSEPKNTSDHLMLQDVIEDPKASIHQLSSLMCLEEGLKQLKPKDYWLIQERYFKDRTQQEIADELFLSQAQVSRMEKKILKHLKDFFI